MPSCIGVIHDGVLCAGLSVLYTVGICCQYDGFVVVHVIPCNICAIVCLADVCGVGYGVGYVVGVLCV